MIDFYISEMAVSDGHGGGLTLQRVLADDLDGIEAFYHVTRMGNDFPAIKRVRSRSISFTNLFEADSVRKKIGCRPADWICRRSVLRQRHADRIARNISDRLELVNRKIRALVCPQGEMSLQAMAAIEIRRDIEYITWIMDDHLVRWESGKWSYPAKIETLFGDHLRRAKKVFVISEVMGDFYKKHFGVDSQVLFGPSNLLESDGSFNGNMDEGIRLAYFGAVAAWQIDALELLARNLTSHKGTLDIYSGVPVLPKSLIHPGVTFKGRIDSELVTATMKAYDAVVLPISFREDLRQMSEFNIATKMSECLAGCPITLVIGPPYAAMVRFLKERRAAIVVEEATTEAVNLALDQFASRKALGEISRNAKDVVRSELSSSVMLKRWTYALDQLGWSD